MALCSLLVGLLVHNMKRIGNLSISARVESSPVEELRHSLLLAIDAHASAIDLTTACPKELDNVDHHPDYVTIDCSATGVDAEFLESTNALCANNEGTQAGDQALIIVKRHTSRNRVVDVDLPVCEIENMNGWVLYDFEGCVFVTESNRFVWNDHTSAFLNDELITGDVILALNTTKKRIRMQQPSPSIVTLEDPIRTADNRVTLQQSQQCIKRHRGERKNPIDQMVASYKKMHDEKLDLHEAIGTQKKRVNSVPDALFELHGPPSQLDGLMTNGSRTVDEWLHLLTAWKDGAVAHVFDVTITNIRSEFDHMLTRQELLAPPCLRHQKTSNCTDTQKIEDRKQRNVAYIRLCLRYTESFGIGASTQSKARGQIYKPPQKGNAGVRLGGKAAPAWDAIPSSMAKTDRMLLPSDKYLSRRVLVMVDEIEALAEENIEVTQLRSRWTEFVASDADLSIITNRYAFDW